MTMRTFAGALVAGLIIFSAVPLPAAPPQDLKLAVDGKMIRLGRDPSKREENGISVIDSAVEQRRVQQP